MTFLWQQVWLLLRSQQTLPFAINKSLLIISFNNRWSCGLLSIRMHHGTPRGWKMSNSYTMHILFLTLGQFWCPDIVVACVPVCVNHEFSCAITHHLFKLGAPNLNQRCKRSWSSLVSFRRVISLALQGQTWLKSLNLSHFELIRTKKSSSS